MFREYLDLDEPFLATIRKMPIVVASIGNRDEYVDLTILTN